MMYANKLLYLFYMLLKYRLLQTKLVVPNTFIFLTLVAFTTVTLLELTQWVQALAAVSTRNIVWNTEINNSTSIEERTESD